MWGLLKVGRPEIDFNHCGPMGVRNYFALVLVGKCLFELQTDGGFITRTVTWWPGNGVIVCKPIGVLTHSDDGIGTIIA